MVGHPAGQVTDRAKHAGIGAQVPTMPGAARPVHRLRAAAPENLDVRPIPAGPDRHDDGRHGQAEQPLAVYGPCGLRLPEGREIRGEQAFVLLLQHFGPSQRGLPASFQLAGNQAVVWVQRIVLALRQAALVAGACEAELSLPVHGLAFLFQVPQRGERGVQLGWPHRLQERLDDDRVDIAVDERLAHGLGVVCLRLPALVTWLLSAVADPRLASAAPALHQALQQRRARPGCTAPLRREVVAIGLELLPVGQEAVVADEGRIDAQDDDGPFLDGQAPLDRGGRVACRNVPADAPIHERAGIGRVADHAVDHAVGWSYPHGLAFLGTSLHDARQTQAVVGEVPQHAACIAQRAEALEHGVHRESHGLIGILYDHAMALRR